MCTACWTARILRKKGITEIFQLIRFLGRILLTLLGYLMVIKAPTLPMLAKGQDFLTCRVADLAKDYDGSRNFPAPFYKASQRLCLKNGWHLGSFLLSMQNNIAYCEHRCTKLTPEVAKSERSFEEAPKIGRAHV